MSAVNSVAASAAAVHVGSWDRKWHTCPPTPTVHHQQVAAAGGAARRLCLCTVVTVNQLQMQACATKRVDLAHINLSCWAQCCCCLTWSHCDPEDVDTHQLTAPSQLLSMAMNARLSDLSSDPSWPAMPNNRTPAALHAVLNTAAGGMQGLCGAC